MRGNVTKRGSTWTVRYDEGYDEHGKRRQRSKGGFRTRRDAQAFLTTTLKSIGDGCYSTPAKTTLAEYLNTEWLPSVEGTLRYLSFRNYSGIVRLYIVPSIGHVRLQSLSGGHLNALYAELEQRGLSPSTRRLTHAVLRRSLRDAVRWGKLVRNPADLADPPAPPKPKAKAWTAKELSRFLEYVHDDELYPLWRLAGTTGMRRGELAGVTWRALDLDAAKLSVEQQLVYAHGGAAFGPPKSERARRTISLDPETVGVLRAHREAQLLERDLAGPAYQDHDLVFANPLGAPVQPQTLTSRFGKLRRAAGLTYGHLHTLRHTVATLALTDEVPLHIVAARIGDDPTTVLKTYCHLLPQGDELAAERLAALIDA